MTDKEKASIRDLLKTADINLSERQTNILCRAWELSLTKVYEQGLAEGRNEQRRLQIAYLENKVTELEKEIDYYKSRECHWDEIEEDAKRIAEENEKLKKDKEWLDNTNNEQTEVILKLQAQIKKMKCCRNCKHFNQVEIHCDLYAKYECVNLDKWKLAE